MLKKYLTLPLLLAGLSLPAFAVDVTVAAKTVPYTNVSGLPATLTGSATVTNGSATVTSSAAFRTQWPEGAIIVLGGVNYYLSSVASTSSLTLASNYAGSSGSVTFTVHPYMLLKFYALQRFTTSDGVLIQSGTPGAGGFYKQVGASVISGTAYVPAVTLPSTTDAFNPSERQARWAAKFYSPAGAFIQDFDCLSQFRLPASPTTTTWQAVCAFNTPATSIVQETAAYTQTQVNNLLASYYLSATGTTNYVQKKSGTTSLGDSSIQDSGSAVTVGLPTTFSGTTAHTGAATFGSTVTLSADPAAGGLQASTAKFADFNGEEVRAYSYATLQLAQAALSSTNTLVVSTALTCSGAVTFTANQKLKFTGTGKIVESGTCTITFQGPAVEAALDKQIFSGFEAGDITWTGKYPDKVSAAWWGMVDDDSTDNATAIQSAIDSLNGGEFPADVSGRGSRGATVIIPPGDNYYYVGSAIHITRPVVFGAESPGVALPTAQLRWPAGTKGIVVHRYNTDWRATSATAAGATNSRADYSVIRNLGLYGGGMSTSQTADISGLTATITSASNWPTDFTPDGNVVEYNGFYYNVNSSDAVVVYTGSTTSGSATLDCTTCSFTAGMVGRAINVAYAGPNNTGLSTTISAYTSSTRVTMATTASATLSNVQVQIAPKVLTLTGPRILATATNGSPTLTNQAGGVTWPTNGWNGQTVTVEGTNYTISSMTGSAITLSSNISLPSGGCVSPCTGTFVVNGLPTASGATVKALNAHGLTAYTGVRISNVLVKGWGGNGINLNTAQFPFGTSAFDTNVDHTLIEYTRAAENLGHGLMLRGQDSNIVTTVNYDGTTNRGACILEGGFLGNTHVTPHCSANWFGTFYMPDHATNNQSVFYGAYTETGSVGGRLEQLATYHGGVDGAGFQRLAAPNYPGGKLMGRTGGGFQQSPTIFYTNYKDYTATSFEVGSNSYFSVGGASNIFSFGTGDVPNGGTSATPTPSYQLLYNRSSGLGNGWFEMYFGSTAAFGFSNSSASQGAGQFALPQGTYLGSAADTKIVRNAAGVTEFNRGTAGSNIGALVTATASGVNYLNIASSTTGNAVTATATGSDTNISVNVVPKGTGVLQAGGVEVVTLSGAQTLTNKTLTTPTIGSFVNAAHTHQDAAGGGQLNASSVFSAGTVPTARLAVLVNTGTYDPPNLAADGDVTATTLTVTGAATSNVCYAGHTQISTNNVLISCAISAADTARVVIQNKTGGALDLASGTLKVYVLQF